MLGRFEYMEGLIDHIDDNLQTLQATCSYQWNELHDSYDSDMYDINTRLSSLMMAQGPRLLIFRAPYSKTLGPFRGQKVEEKVFLLLLLRFLEWSLMATCRRLPPYVYLCFYGHVLLLCC